MGQVAAQRELALSTTAQEVSQARRFAVAAAADLGGDDEAQDRVRTLVCELVTNVVLHAATPSVVAVRDDGDLITVLVTDGCAAPARPQRASADHATGRGLAMVQVLSTDHGSRASDRIGPGGKTIWFSVPKLAAAPVVQLRPADAALVLLGGAAAPTVKRPGAQAVVTVPDDPPQPVTGPLHEVRILGAPVRVWKRAASHTADLMREFALLQIGRDSGTTAHELPQALLGLVGDLNARYAGVSTDQEVQLDVAVAAGERSRDFVHHVPMAVGEACLTLLELLDAADDHCAAGTDLLTLVSPPDQRAFRHWYLLEFVRQVQGHPPTPWSGATD